MSQETAVIPFHNSALRAAKVDDQVWIAIKPICEHLGIDWAAQHQKLRQDDRFSCRVIPMTAADGVGEPGDRDDSMLTAATETLYNSAVKKPSAKSNSVMIRVSDREKEMMLALSERTGMNYSELFRSLLRRGFEEEMKKETR